MGLNSWGAAFGGLTLVEGGGYAMLTTPYGRYAKVRCLSVPLGSGRFTGGGGGGGGALPVDLVGSAGGGGGGALAACGGADWPSSSAAPASCLSGVQRPRVSGEVATERISGRLAAALPPEWSRARSTSDSSGDTGVPYRGTLLPPEGEAGKAAAGPGVGVSVAAAAGAPAPAARPGPLACAEPADWRRRWSCARMSCAAA